MAKKLKLMSLFQELAGRALVTNRKPSQPAAGVYLMQLRSLVGQNTLPRRRLTISVNLGKAQPQPHPVKINHVRGAATLPEAQPEPTSNVSVSAPPQAVSQVQPPRGQ
jgi:hypothetical protein